MLKAQLLQEELVHTQKLKDMLLLGELMLKEIILVLQVIILMQKAMALIQM